MKHLRSVLIFSAAFILVTGLLLAGAKKTGFFNVMDIPVSILEESTGANNAGAPVTAQAAASSGLQNRLEKLVSQFEKRRIWEVDLSRMKQAVLGDEWVQDVLISRSFPNQINVRVRPKTAVLVWVNPVRAGFSPITRDGALLSALQPELLPDVPLLRGEAFAKDIGKRKKAIDFAMMLPTTGAVSRRNVSEIAWSYEEGFLVTLVQPKIEIRFGENQLEIKIARVAQVLNYLTSHQLKGRVIDASYQKKVLVRLRKGS
jgi:cell division protein FtsQ